MSLTEEKPRAKFTPGPWQRIGTTIGTPYGGKLAMTCVEDCPADKTRAALDRMHDNARLIVEAPAMYDVLNEVLLHLTGGPQLHPERVTRIRQLINRIDGD